MKSERERPGSVCQQCSYETVTSYCFSKWWLDSKRQDWWPTSRGPLKQAFGVHPTEAADTGLTHRKYEDLKRYVQGVNCVAVGEIGLDHVRVRQDKGRDQQAEVFSRLCRLAKEVGKPVVIHCRGHSEGVFVDHEEQPTERPNGVLAPFQ